MSLFYVVWAFAFVIRAISSGVMVGCLMGRSNRGPLNEIWASLAQNVPSKAGEIFSSPSLLQSNWRELQMQRLCAPLVFHRQREGFLWGEWQAEMCCSRKVILVAEALKTRGEKNWILELWLELDLNHSNVINYMNKQM